VRQDSGGGERAARPQPRNQTTVRRLRPFARRDLMTLRPPWWPSGHDNQSCGRAFAVRAKCRFHILKRKRGSEVSHPPGGVKGAVVADRWRNGWPEVTTSRKTTHLSSLALGLGPASLARITL
jgi:hypothetical protein